MKKIIYIILAAILLCSVIAGAAVFWFSATDYQGTEVLYNGIDSREPISVRLSNDNIEVTDIYAENNLLHYTVVPKQPGTTVVKLLQDDSRILVYGEVYVLPFQRVIADVSTLDCNGSRVLVILFFADLALLAVSMTAAFFWCRKQAAFGYTMLNCGGIALFCWIYAAVLLYALFAHPQPILTLGTLLRAATVSVPLLVTVTAPFMTAFAVAVLLSNVVLLRREGFYVLRLGCLLLSSLWLLALALNLLFLQQRSGESHAVWRGISNVCAVIMGYGICLLLSTVATAWTAAHRKPSLDRDYIIILGCAVRRDGSPTPLLQSRVEAALAFDRAQFAKTGKHAVWIATGGSEKPNATAPCQAVQRCLSANGIPAERIRTEEKSVSTFQNLLYAGEMIEQNGDTQKNIAFATSDYHMLRSYVLAGKVPLSHVQGIAAKTKWVFYPNSILRELLGLLAQDMHKHALIVAVLSSLVFFAALVTYLR